MNIPWKPNKMLKILLADDHMIVRQGVRALLEREGFEVVGEAANGHEAVRLAEGLQPDLAILDLTMPLLNGLYAAHEIRQVTPKTKTILLTMHTEDHYILEALRLGIDGYVLKSKAASELVQAIQEVSRGGIYLSSGVSQTLVQAYLTKSHRSTDSLTILEREVIQLVAEGKTTKEIGVLLGISTKRAESHRSRIMNKLDIHETASLVRYAIRQGLIQP
jgi:DNA-binding NarL/FixJ family response regulator